MGTGPPYIRFNANRCFAFLAALRAAIFEGRKIRERILTFGVVGRKEGLSNVLLSLLQPLLPPQLDGVNIGFLFHYSLELRLKVAALAGAPGKVRLIKNVENCELTLSCSLRATFVSLCEPSDL